MKLFVAVALLSACVLCGITPQNALAAPSARSQGRDTRKADKKQRKAMKKYAKAQRKAQRKMIKQDRKNTRRF